LTDTNVGTAAAAGNPQSGSANTTDRASTAGTAALPVAHTQPAHGHLALPSLWRGVGIRGVRGTLALATRRKHGDGRDPKASNQSDVATHNIAF